MAPTSVGMAKVAISAVVLLLVGHGMHVPDNWSCINME